MGRIMGIDWGEKFVGIALSDPSKVLATGYRTLPFENFEELFKEIKRIVEEKGVEKIVVGLPKRTDGKKGWVEEKVREFAEKLKLFLKKEVKLWDERYSTLIAQEYTQDKNKVHLLAAEIILQSYLESLRK
ncbi:Holliday junction resolvase RuvX [Candidatus Calescamantes bacterium]|nr:Holliday junction resolvase RuvX [Candidatus Calescamantes bacterium]